jgi:hypothetical protein
MRWIVWIIGGIGSVITLVSLIGWRLPKAHTAMAVARVPLPPEALYTLLSDVSQYQSWRTELTELHRLPDRNGRPAWIEETRRGRIPFYFERMERPALLVTRIADPSLPFGGTWTYQISGAPDGGSDLTITENGEVYNPIFRFMARFVFGYRTTLDAFVGNLEKRVGR